MNLEIQTKISEFPWFRSKLESKRLSLVLGICLQLVRLHSMILRKRIKNQWIKVRLSIWSKCHIILFCCSFVEMDELIEVSWMKLIQLRLLILCVNSFLSITILSLNLKIRCVMELSLYSKKYFQWWKNSIQSKKTE